MHPIFYEIFETLPRLGPGNNESTTKAFNILKTYKTLNQNLQILDIGCGTGIHTIQLAKLVHSKITAMDNRQHFLNTLKTQAKTNGISDKINCIMGDMGKMDFPEGSIDLIWSEGSIFILGLEKGLKEWHKFLKSTGHLIFSDLFLFKSYLPKELISYWEEVYPGIMDINGGTSIIKKSGYKIIDHFPLPEEGWMVSYHGPLEEKLILFREKYKKHPEGLEIVNNLQKEIDIYREYSEYYGYEFFILEKE